MPTRDSLKLITLVRAVIILSSPVLMTLALAMIFGALTFNGLVYSYTAILVLTAIIVKPLLSNVNTLTEYVNNLSEDRQADEPSLRYLSAVSGLPAALIELYHSWERKKKHTASLITEYETLVDSLPDILIMCNNSQKIIRTNKAAREMFGQNLANKSLSSIIPSDELLDGVTAVLEERQGRKIEFHLSTVLRDFRAIINLFFPAASGESIAVIISLSDITELQRLERMRAEFVANASHEIRTPLASIKGFIETLRVPARDDPEALDEFLKIMDDQATRMKGLIDDLLTLSKIQASERSLPSGKVDIAQIARNEKEAFVWAAKEKNMTLRLDITEGLPSVQGDEKELRQVVHNLISNALKYGNPGTEVIVNMRVTSLLPDDPNFARMHRAICMSVIDNGEGIPREHLPRLTERFYRVDSARTRTIGGTGLGLAIVKHIISRHQGVMIIDSVVGQGSTFSVFLQIYDEEE